MTTRVLLSEASVPGSRLYIVQRDRDKADSYDSNDWVGGGESCLVSVSRVICSVEKKK